jgi:adenylate cyclase class 2
MLETEVKFLLTDPAAFRRRLQAAGAVARGEVSEINYRYDDAGGRLQAARCLLRLRRDRRNWLTFKKPHPAGGHQFKTHEEIEIAVSDFDSAAQLLESLGFRRVQIYEKRRATFELAAAEICLDHMPFGHFIEIEGPPEAVVSIADALALPWSRRILANYLQIFAFLRESFALPFDDVTFANFESVQADMTDLIRRFEGGISP